MQYTGLFGLLFLVVGLSAMFLMYRLWGYPFDKATRTSAAPRWAMKLHRRLGYLFVVIYLGLMWHMVPRLWQYQVEFAARTTAHIVLGFSIGFLLMIKIAIMRWFRHFEEWMPFLGTAIMLGTVVLLGLSLPYVLREDVLANAAFSDANRARVAQLLPAVGFPDDASLSTLSGAHALAAGRAVLTESCVACHDLKTILAKPRTPAAWWSTVERMAEKPALFRAMTPSDLYQVTAYLIAITPDLQRAAKQRYHKEVARSAAAVAAHDVAAAAPAAEGDQAAADADAAVSSQRTLDMTLARGTYEKVCSQCHELADIDKAPPRSRAEARAMIERMIKDNDAEVSAPDVRLIVAWLEAHYVDKKL